MKPRIRKAILVVAVVVLVALALHLAVTGIPALKSLNPHGG